MLGPYHDLQPLFKNYTTISFHTNTLFLWYHYKNVPHFQYTLFLSTNLQLWDIWVDLFFSNFFPIKNNKSMRIPAEMSFFKVIVISLEFLEEDLERHMEFTLSKLW